MTGTQRQQNEHKQQNHHEDHRLEVPLVALQIQTQGQIPGMFHFRWFIVTLSRYEVYDLPTGISIPLMLHLQPSKMKLV